MSQAFYEQDEETENRLVCPDCGREILISEYGETGLCPECFDERPIGEHPTKEFFTRFTSVSRIKEVPE